MKRKPACLLALFLLISLVATACSAGTASPADVRLVERAFAQEDGETGAINATSGPDESMRYGGAGGAMGAELIPQPAAQEAGAAVREAKLIRKAQLELQTLAFNDAVSALEALTERLGGYLENSSVNGGNYYEKNAMRWASFTIRVPQDQYDAFLNGAGDVGHVVSKSQTQEDIGELYYDTELRLKTQQVKHERLLNLLSKAELMEDIISLETAISDTEYQIEQYTSSLKRYDALVNYATIEVQLSEVLKLEDSPVQTLDTQTRVVNAFGAGVKSVGESMGNLVVWFAYHFLGVLVFLVAATVGIVIVTKKFRRNHRPKQRQMSETPKEGEGNKPS